MSDDDLKRRERRNQHRHRNLLHKPGEVIVGSADPEVGAPGGTVPAVIEDLQALKGQWFRNARTDTYVKVIDVGREGVIVQDCDGPFLPGYGEQYGITWKALRALYHIQVSARDVAGAK